RSIDCGPAAATEQPLNSCAVTRSICITNDPLSRDLGGNLLALSTLPQTIAPPDDYPSCLFFFQAEDGIRDRNVTGVQTCALPILACRRDRHLDAERAQQPVGPEPAAVDDDGRVDVLRFRAHADHA